MMRIVAVSMVKNECDIIESFIRYHAAIFDFIYILDNQSADSTVQIINLLRDEGLPVILQRDETGSYEQSRKMTELMRLAAVEKTADYVFPLDVDEFVLTLNRQELEARLQNLRGGVGLLQWFDYIALPEDDCTEADPLRRICHRIEPAPERYKVCIPYHIAIRPSVELDWGQHRVLEDKTPIDGVLLAPPILAHIPLRSGAQLFSKAIIGRLALRASPDWNPALGSHWDRIAESIKTPSSVTAEEVHRATLILAAPDEDATIVQSKLPLPYDGLRYSDLSAIDPLQRLLSFTSYLLDDEEAVPDSHPDQTGKHRNRLAHGVLPREWRRRWREAEDKVRLLEAEIARLRRRRRVSYLVTRPLGIIVSWHRARQRRRSSRLKANS